LIQDDILEDREARRMNRKEFIAKVVCGGTAAVACSGIPCCRAAAQTVKAADPQKDVLERRARFADAWMKRLMTVVDSQLDPQSRLKLMESNGRACYASYKGERPAKIQPDALDQLIAEMKKWSGEDGVRREGNTIHLTYGPAGAGEKRCLCPMVENITAGLSATYCHCSVGYVKEMFERATGKPVQVDLAESLKRGGKACRFLIKI
jgi:hypothetical protein